MDNEPEIWGGTHDDVVKEDMGPEEFMQLYFEVAKKARASFPDIKLVGPVTANEWQWYNWYGNVIESNGEKYVWLEYFIKRIGEEQKATGIKLLDVFDIHFYPDETKAEDIVQLHRVYFDKNYVYPGANGVKRLNGGWDNSINKEYIFERCKQWMEEFIGPGHGITFGVSETGIKSDDPNVVASWYASTLGEFASNGVEFFTPWTWKAGMYEVLHLLSNYTKPFSVQSNSSNEKFVSAYSSINNTKDSATITLVNRSLSQGFDVEISVPDFGYYDGFYHFFRLQNLPDNTETFKSASNNHLKKDSILVRDGIIKISVPKLSITSILLSQNGYEFIDTEEIKLSTENSRQIIEEDKGSLQFFAETLPQNSSFNDISWSVSNDLVASVDQNGLVTAISNGEVWIIAHQQQTGVKDSILIEIINQYIPVLQIQFVLP
jgi:hypothetical protein